MQKKCCTGVLAGNKAGLKRQRTNAFHGCSKAMHIAEAEAIRTVYIKSHKLNARY